MRRDLHLGALPWNGVVLWGLALWGCAPGEFEVPAFTCDAHTSITATRGTVTALPNPCHDQLGESWQDYTANLVHADVGLELVQTGVDVWSVSVGPDVDVGAMLELVVDISFAGRREDCPTSPDVLRTQCQRECLIDEQGPCVVGNVAFTVTVAAPTEYRLDVFHSGLGSGQVTSDPVGIECPDSCSVVLSSGTLVVLTATPEVDHQFMEWWGGECTGTAPHADFVLEGDATCIARFEPESGDAPTACFTVEPATPVVGDTVLLDGSCSVDPDGEVVEWAWDLDGDGETDLLFSNLPSTWYSIQTSGEWAVTLQVTDNQGQWHSVTQVIDVGGR